MTMIGFRVTWLIAGMAKRACQALIPAVLSVVLLPERLPGDITKSKAETQ